MAGGGSGSSVPQPDGTIRDRYILTPDLGLPAGLRSCHRVGMVWFGLVGGYRTLSARYYKDGSEILIRQASGVPTTDPGNALVSWDEGLRVDDRFKYGFRYPACCH
jgi:hypothetical protein